MKQGYRLDTTFSYKNYLQSIPLPLQTTAKFRGGTGVVSLLLGITTEYSVLCILSRVGHIRPCSGRHGHQPHSVSCQSIPRNTQGATGVPHALCHSLALKSLPEESWNRRLPILADSFRSTAGGTDEHRIPNKLPWMSCLDESYE